MEMEPLSAFILTEDPPLTAVRRPDLCCEALRIDPHLHGTWKTLAAGLSTTYYSLRPWFTLWVTRLLITLDEPWSEPPMDPVKRDEWVWSYLSASAAMRSTALPKLDEHARQVLQSTHLLEVMWPTEAEVELQTLQLLRWRETETGRRQTALQSRVAYADLFGCGPFEATRVTEVLRTQVREINRVSTDDRRADVIQELMASGARPDATPAAQIAATRGVANAAGVSTERDLSMEDMVRLISSKKPLEILPGDEVRSGDD